MEERKNVAGASKLRPFNVNVPDKVKLGDSKHLAKKKISKI